jgi:hypothetical protein
MGHQNVAFYSADPSHQRGVCERVSEWVRSTQVQCVETQVESVAQGSRPHTQVQWQETRVEMPARRFADDIRWSS